MKFHSLSDYHIIVNFNQEVIMKKITKKITVALMSFLLLLPTFIGIPQSVSAQEEKNDIPQTEEKVTFTESEKQQIKEEIEFYFTEVGYINEDGKYIVTNPEALAHEFEKHGIEFSMTQNATVFRSVPQYVFCVVANSLPFPFTGTAYELGMALANSNDFRRALMQGSVDSATEILMSYASDMLTGSMLRELKNFSLVTNIAVALVSCGLN